MLPLEKLTRARAALIVAQPFFGALALHLRLEESEDVETMATDGERLMWSPAFVDGLTGPELQAVVAHEVMHCAMLHHVRRGRRDLPTWNRACDFAVNRDLVAAGFKLPSGALLDSRFDGLGAEDIFRALEAEKTQEQPKAGKNPSAGAGGKAPDPGRMGGVVDAAPAHEPAKVEAAATEWTARVRQALAVAKAQGAGKLPGHLARVAEETARPRIDWTAELRRFIDHSTVRDFSWSRPNRRHVGRGVILPGYVSNSLAHLVVVVDTSGSIDQTALAAFRAELAAALDEGAADRVSVVYCDTKVTGTAEFERGDALEMTAKGGGGTRFAPAFAWIAENAPDASAVVFFTDLDCRDFGEEPAAPVLWAAWGDPRAIDRRAARVPFGEVLRVAA